MKNMVQGGRRATSMSRQKQIGPETPNLLSTMENRGQTTQTHRRQTWGTPLTQIGEKKQTHRGRERQGQHAHNGERDNRRGCVSWRTKIQSQTSGMRHQQPGERERGPRTVQLGEAWGKRKDNEKVRRERERGRERERERHTAWTMCL